MKGRAYRWIQLAFLALGLVACSPPKSTFPPLPRTPLGAAGRPFQKGMVYGIFSRAGESFHRRNLKELANLGINSIEIVVPRSIPSIYSTELAGADPMVTPSRTSVTQAIRQAHRQGLAVFLFPILFVQDLEGEEWRGALAPLDWDVWWRHYTDWILTEARWAAAQDVEIFSVGSELCSAEPFNERWEALIAQVRAVFPGQITYSANWDHLQEIRFAGALDFIGMNAYFEVGSPHPTLDGLLDRWQPILRQLDAWQARLAKPVVVTEIGYQSKKGSTLHPWDYLAEGEEDPVEQDLGYRAFMAAWSTRHWFAGCYFYLWWEENDKDGRGYTPRGKPAAGSIAQWYNQENH
ncbi:MAG: hypothetical protein ACE5ID_06020 [Acidobacteriota bacterium]